MAGTMHLGNMICSLIFNLRYYDSLAGALGGRSAFEELLRGQDVAVLLQRLSEHQEGRSLPIRVHERGGQCERCC